MQRCITCPSGTSPNSGGDACVPDSNTLDNTTPLEDLQFVIEELGLGINVGAATEVGNECKMRSCACSSAQESTNGPLDLSLGCTC
eukprot:1147765-Pelagomonas_calceolata.AAC.1